MNPILLDLPIPIGTPRLILRPPQAGDGLVVNQAVLESFDTLNQWMPWADHKPSIEESEMFVRTAQAQWILRQELTLFIFDSSKTTLLGATGFHTINWKLPSFEIGYWIRSSYTGQGIITESTNALVCYAFKQLKAVRVEIKCDEDNIASRRVAEKLSFICEGILKNSELKTDNKTIRDTVIYARYNENDLPPLEVFW